MCKIHRLSDVQLPPPNFLQGALPETRRVDGQCLQFIVLYWCKVWLVSEMFAGSSVSHPRNPNVDP